MKWFFPGFRCISVSEMHWDPFPFASCGEIVPWHLVMWLYGEGLKLLVNRFLEPSGCPALWCLWPLLLPGAPCSGTVSEPRPWAWLSWFAQRLRTCRCVLSSPCVLHCPAFLHRGYLALLGELFLRYPLEWQSMGIADCLFGCHCNSPALFLL